MKINASQIAASFIVFVVVAVFGLTAPRQAQAQWVVTDPGHTWQTILSETKRAADAAADYAQQVQQVQTQLQQYQNMVQQGLSLPDAVWASVNSDIQRLAAIYEGSRTLAHSVSNLDERFRQQFSGYDSFVDQIADRGSRLPEKYRAWSEQGYDNARTALRAAGLQTSMFQQEDAVLNQLVERSASAEGRMQAIQAGNEIAAQQVQQMQKLREMIASQMTLQANWIAQQTERSAQDDAFNETFRSVPLQRSPAREY